jgi:hypothetical protein
MNYIKIYSGNLLFYSILVIILLDGYILFEPARHYLITSQLDYYGFIIGFAICETLITYSVLKGNYPNTVAKVLISINLLILLFIKPVISTDFYFNLAASKIFWEIGKNPYITTIGSVFSEANQIHRYIDWPNTPLILGPITLLINILPALANKLIVSILITRILALTSYTLTYMLLARIIEHLEIKKINKETIRNFLFLSPLMYMHLLVDLHFEVFIMFFVTLLAYSLLKKNIYGILISVFFIMGIKYFGIVLIILPVLAVIKMFTKQEPHRYKALLFSVVLLILGLCIIKYFFNDIAGLSYLVRHYYGSTQGGYSLFYYWLHNLFGNKVGITVFAILFSTLVCIWFYSRKKYMEAVYMPILVFLLLSFSLASWYWLWLYPGILLIIKKKYVLVLSFFLALTMYKTGQILTFAIMLSWATLFAYPKLSKVIGRKLG